MPRAHPTQEASAGSPSSVRTELVALWERLAPLWGISAGAARLLAGLLARSQPAGAEELMQELGMSRGAVSMAARELADWGLLRPEREAGSRRLRYVAETDLERAMRSIIATRKRREWDPLLVHLPQWIERLERERGADGRALAERLRDIHSVVALVDSMSSAFLQGGMVQKLGLKAVLAAARSKRRPSAAT
jgi:DNA-binding transcriptional regulator GbsR (MarR family)